MIANKQTVLDKIKIVKRLDAEILDLVKDEEIEDKIENSTDFELLCNGELFEVDHFVKELEEKKKNKRSGYPPEAPAGQPHMGFSSDEVVRLRKLVIKPFMGVGTSWITFAYSFRSAIDSSTKLSTVEKMNYLFGYLEGPALKTERFKTLQ